MINIDRHDDGFAVTWSADMGNISRLIRMELTLEGLQRNHEWANGIVIDAYRNEFETLELIAGVIERLGFPYRLGKEIAASQKAGEAERGLIQQIKNGKPRKIKVSTLLPEFAAGRPLLPYQKDAVATHLRIRNGAEFSVPGSGKTTVACG
jgi:hypothetical protein